MGRNSKSPKRGGRPIRNSGERGRGYQRVKDLAESFHGRPSKGSQEVQRTLFYNRNLAELGLLECLEIIDDENPDDIIELEFTPEDNLKLTSTADAKQLIIVGKVEITPDMIDNVPEQEWEKHTVFLGEVLAVCYFADKHHLTGPKSQAKGTSYRHEFGEKTDIRPMAVYNQRTKEIELVGGAYTVLDVGITG